jgi:Tfp pilus assembly protein PilX
MMRSEHGVALVVTLILLSGLGALALAAAAAAAAALALSSHQQSAQNAFQAAEAGIVQSLSRAAVARSEGSIPATPFPESGNPVATLQTVTTAVMEPGALPFGFSIGENPNTFSASHFFIVSDGRAARGTHIRLEQGFYLVEPAG